MPVMLPAAVSFYIGLIKDTSVAYIVGLHELLRPSQLIAVYDVDPMEIYLVAAAIYFVICFPLSRLAPGWRGAWRSCGIVQERLAV